MQGPRAYQAGLHWQRPALNRSHGLCTVAGTSSRACVLGSMPPNPLHTMGVHARCPATQAGDSFDLATLACSLLLGAGYSAYVVVGYASKQVRPGPRGGAWHSTSVLPLMAGGRCLPLVHCLQSRLCLMHPALWPLAGGARPCRWCCATSRAPSAPGWQSTAWSPPPLPSCRWRSLALRSWREEQGRGAHRKRALVQRMPA